MSLYGALFSGVSGLAAQGAAISMLGDNISNINTVGYKGSAASFSTLLTDSSSSTAYSSGGVQSSASQLIDKQGLIQGTGVVTDLAVSGDGFFVVNSSSDGSGSALYTRAGSFRKDDKGNYVNNAGYTLMAWPLNGEGKLPGQPGNFNTTSSALLDSLKPVNIKAVSGTAAATTKISLGMNLKASQEVLHGSGETAKFPSTALGNLAIGANDVIIPESLSPSLLAQGNTLTLTTGSLTNYTYNYVYGGVVNSAGGTLFGAASPSVAFTTGITNGDNFTMTNGTSGAVTFTYTTTSPNTATGQFNSLNTLAEAMNHVSGITARIKNGAIYIAPKDGKEGMSFVDNTGTIAASLGGNIAAGTGVSTANRFTTLDGLTKLINNSTGVKAVLESPLDTSSVNIFAADPLDTLQFSGTNAIALGKDPFTTGAALSTVVTVNQTAHGLSNGDVIYIDHATTVDGVTIGAGSYTVAGAAANSYTITGGNITGAAILGTTAGGGGDATVSMPNLGANPFTTTAAAIGAASTVTVTTPTAHGLKIGDTVNFPGTAISLDGGNVVVSGSYVVTAINSSTSFSFEQAAGPGAATAAPTVIAAGAVDMESSAKMLKEFGLSTLTAANLKPAYDPQGGSAPNIASGGVTPQFSRNVRVFDAEGSGHDFQTSYVKIGPNTWGVEIYALDPKDITSSRTDGLITSGTIQFNGDGSLRSVTPSLTADISVSWANRAAPNTMKFSFGTAGPIAGTVGVTSVGLTDGFRQFDANYDVSFVDQNGVSSGLLTSVNIDADGFVIANFSNGQSRKIYKVPLADFVNPNGLTSKVGNAYAESQKSGNFNLKEAGSGGIGKITPASLEQANVELSDELTRMIVAQRGYQASSKVIKTADDLLDNLIRTFS
jgi:flagellar hook protein FlgE